MTKLLSSPYQTNCYDYNKLGCKSRNDCINKCNIELSLKLCNSLPQFTNVDRHNDKDIYNITNCTMKFDYSICEDEFRSPDCVNEYYFIKPIIPERIYGAFPIETFLKMNGTKRGMKNDYSLFTNIQISFSDEPDTIYRYSPEQYTIEFVTFLCGVISLWTGFSIISMYAYLKRFLKIKKGELKLADIKPFKRTNKSSQIEVRSNDKKRNLFRSKSFNNEVAIKIE